MFSKSIVAGYIATMVWLMPSADQAKTWVILIITRAVASFRHYRRRQRDPWSGVPGGRERNDFSGFGHPLGGNMSAAPLFSR